ncbi:MAG: hypothetical protein WAN23_14670 [Candidatus Acidiferrales bacterium]
MVAVSDNGLPPRGKSSSRMLPIVARPVESEVTTTVVLGAGFSKCAGLPLQDEFSELLLSDDFEGEIEETITATLREFLRVVFGWKKGHRLPMLEDVFTCIDLAAGSGHNLGIPKYTPKMLRAIRRMAIFRIFSVLDRRFSWSPDITKLINHACGGEAAPAAFVVLNWDIVLEKHILAALQTAIDYRCYCFNWHTRDVATLGNGIPICKMHGSSNWAYCENCKALFYDLEQKLPLRIRAGLIKGDFRLFNEGLTDAKFDKALAILPAERNCRFCHFPVSSHIATFSYRKSFRTHAYPSIWYHAERLLSESTRWIFVGYSLPEADFELKHVLKSSCLRMQHSKTKAKKQIDVVVLNDNATQEKYERFFGAGEIRVYQGGLSEYVSKL